MSRYIDADALVEELKSCSYLTWSKDINRAWWAQAVQVKDNIVKCIERQPTADVVEVRHGEWIEKDDGWDGVLYTCSVCHCDWTTIDGTPFENNMRYCPECGAKMDGERNKDDT